MLELFFNELKINLQNEYRNTYRPISEEEYITLRIKQIVKCLLSIEKTQDEFYDLKNSFHSHTHSTHVEDFGRYYESSLPSH